MVGGSLGALAAGLTAVGTIALTGGIGLLAAGPVVAALAGAGAGATAGGALGGLIGLGFDKNEATLVDRDLENGAILIAAESRRGDEEQIREVLKSAGASKVTIH